MKRVIDILISAAALLVSLPIIVGCSVLIFLHDRGSPLYFSPRVGKDGKVFGFVKLRTMGPGADRTGVDTTVEGDSRITPIGSFIRRFKLDELPQFWHVLTGQMSMVGPRPNVVREVDLYTQAEQALLQIRPGITDLSSIVFSDLGAVLAGSADPNSAYRQFIRPWKSRLGLLYITTATLSLDLKIMFLTGLAIASKSRARQITAALVASLGASSELQRVASAPEILISGLPPENTPATVSEYLLKRDSHV